jgi:hypothetical protein
MNHYQYLVQDVSCPKIPYNQSQCSVLWGGSKKDKIFTPSKYVQKEHLRKALLALAKLLAMLSGKLPVTATVVVFTLALWEIQKHWIDCFIKLFKKMCCIASMEQVEKNDACMQLNNIFLTQRILKGEVSLYHWPPAWLVWNQLYAKWQFLFLFAKQTNPNQSNRSSMVQWYFPL